ncbi:MAG: protein-glutamine glutaminase family protein [Candidatus Eremiobacterota bacterium]
MNHTVAPLGSRRVLRDFRMTAPSAAAGSSAALDQVAVSHSPSLPLFQPLNGNGAARTPDPHGGRDQIPAGNLELAPEGDPKPVPSHSPTVLADLDGSLGRVEPGAPRQVAGAAAAGVPTVLAQMDPAPAPQAVSSQVRIDQRAFQDSLQLELGGPRALVLQNVDDLSTPRGRLPSSAELNRISQAFCDSSGIPFEYIKDGCYARAHLMCESLRQNGINCSKVFAFGKLGAENDLQEATWWFHVAPMVFVQEPDSGAVDVRVLDPGVDREPMAVACWIKCIHRHGTVKVDLTDAAQYLPRKHHGKQTDFAAHIEDAVTTLTTYSTALNALAGPVRGGSLAEGRVEGDQPMALFPQGLGLVQGLAKDAGMIGDGSGSVHFPGTEPGSFAAPSMLLGCGPPPDPAPPVGLDLPCATSPRRPPGTPESPLPLASEPVMGPQAWRPSGAA